MLWAGAADPVSTGHVGWAVAATKAAAPGQAPPLCVAAVIKGTVLRTRPPRVQSWGVLLVESRAGGRAERVACRVQKVCWGPGKGRKAVVGRRTRCCSGCAPTSSPWAARGRCCAFVVVGSAVLRSPTGGAGAARVDSASQVVDGEYMQEVQELPVREHRRAGRPPGGSWVSGALRSSVCGDRAGSDGPHGRHPRRVEAHGHYTRSFLTSCAWE